MPLLTDTVCLVNHCYATRERTYTGDHTGVYSVTGVIERPDPFVDTEGGFSAVPVWVSRPTSNAFLEIGILKGDGVHVPCVGCAPFPTTPTIYSYIGGAGVASSIRWGNHGSPGYRTMFRIKREKVVLVGDVWIWELCRSGDCDVGERRGWQEVRRTTITPTVFPRIVAGGEVALSSTNVMGVAGILDLRYDLLSGSDCGGLGQVACNDWFVPTDTRYEVLGGPPPTPQKYRSVYQSRSIQVRTTCHVDGTGCP
jgi:hypothetical protein